MAFFIEKEITTLVLDPLTTCHSPSMLQYLSRGRVSKKGQPNLYLCEANHTVITVRFS